MLDQRLPTSNSGGRKRRFVAHRTDPPLPEVFTRDDARAVGLTDRQIDARLASEVWISLRRGVFRRRGLPGEAEAVAALITHRDRDLALSHGTAAMVHGLWQPLGGWGRPTATTAGGPTRLRDDVHLLVAPLGVGDVVLISGLPVTSLGRTVADCARSMSPFNGLATADSAARQGLSFSELMKVLATQKGWPGIKQARRIAALMNPRRESPLESWSAWAFEDWEVPAPEWQVDITMVGGVFCGRVDAWWEEGLAGEADGKAKYLLAAAERGGADAARLSDVLDAQREREARISRTSAEVVRWGAKDLVRPHLAEPLMTFIRTHLRQLTRTHPFRGSTSIPALRLPAPNPATRPLTSWPQ